MAKFITIKIEDIMPDTDTTITVNYSWNSIDGITTASGGGDEIFNSATLSSVINQNIIDQACTDSAAAGITIGLLDRKILMHNLV